jgi:mannose-6-phosphate isomerase-like protein (cupin superfamily)/heme-degrading monooxygenase HmoA
VITRLWRGWTRPADADAYERFLLDELFPSMRAIAGFAGADVLRRPDGDEEAFVTLTRFASLDAIRAFAGDDYERPVLEPRARELLSRYDDVAQHFETAAFAPAPAPAPPSQTPPGTPPLASRELSAKPLPAEPDVTAPDGSDVRILLRTEGGSTAHFELGPGRTSLAVRHRTVEEVWYFLSGRGHMWRRTPDGDERIDEVGPGVSIDIPVGTAFQFRTIGDEPLSALGMTMPPWPNDDAEAIPVDGPWAPA